MPYLKVQTNTPVDNDASTRLLERASKTVSHELGKPEKYVMVAIEAEQPMAFAGDTAPCAYLELKSIGLPQERTVDLSRALCDLVENELGIPADRTFVEFTDAPRALWGWDRRTF